MWLTVEQVADLLCENQQVKQSKDGRHLCTVYVDDELIEGVPSEKVSSIETLKREVMKRLQVIAGGHRERL